MDVTAYVFNLFMDSSDHRKNIMGKDWDVVAVGAYRTTGDHYVWTVLFADRAAVEAPAHAQAHAQANAQARRDRPLDAQARAHEGTHPGTDEEAAADRRPHAVTGPDGITHSWPDPEPRCPAAQPGVCCRSRPRRTSPPGTAALLPAGGLRIVDAPADRGLVDSILFTVTSQFFGF